MKNKNFYTLSYVDIQTVAEEELDRRLTLTEIESITEKISERIQRYDAIAEVLHEYFDNENEQPG